MSNLEKWCKAILNEDADKMSIGSVRTIQLIKQEFERLQKESISQSKQIEELKAENERLKGIMLKAVRKYEAEMTNPFCMEWFKEAKKLIHNY